MPVRREFLTAIPAAFATGFLTHTLRAQTASATGTREAVEFWVQGMGVAPWEVAGGEIAGSKSLGTATGNFAREPVFLHYDARENAVIPAGELTSKHLIPEGGDAQVDFQLQRLRLSPDDHQQFHRYSSGGIYLEMQQHETAPAGVNPELFVALASSVFSAIFPAAIAGSAGKGKTTAPANRTGKPAGTPQPVSLPAAATPGIVPARSVALQQAKQAQSLPLPNGLGKTAFAAFAKEKRKSAFGQFVSALARLGTPETPYLQMLALPLVAVPALAGIRTLVANLQIEGGDQAPIMQAPLTDVATTARALEQSPNALRLRTGPYIAVPREHTSGLKDRLKGLKVMGGFLVPKETTDIDLFDAVAATLPNVSYLCLDVRVRKAKLGNCPG